MKRITSLLLILIMLFTMTSCGNNTVITISSDTAGETKNPSIENDSSVIESAVNQISENSSENNDDILTVNEVDDLSHIKNLNDPILLQYMEDSISAKLAGSFTNEDYIIENVSAIYYSKEYLEELAYNSQSNIFFGYTLEELDDQFGDSRYIFTLGDNGETVVEPFEDYDDTYDRVIKNVAIGTGVILICVTVSVVTAGTAAAPVSLIFAASAKSATTMALSSGMISAVVTGTIKGIQTGDFSEAIKAGSLAGSESFKWGAIFGAISGALTETNALRNASKVAENTENATHAIDSIPSWKASEETALNLYGGKAQVSYISGTEVPYGTPGAVRPDIVRQTEKGILEAIEVKNYDLASSANRNELYNVLIREIGERVKNLPSGTTQRIVLDVTGRQFSSQLIKQVMEDITVKLMDIYPNIPIDIIGAVL